MNGSFDAGPGLPWVEDSGGGGYPLIVDAASGLPVPPWSPPYAAWLGGEVNATHTLYQDVEVPIATTSLSLRGYLRIESEASSTADWVQLEIRTTAGVLLENLQRWYGNDPTQGVWRFFQLPVSSDDYHGQAIRLQLRAYNDAAYPTSFLLDSLELDATIPTGVAEPGVMAKETWAETKAKYR